MTIHMIGTREEWLAAAALRAADWVRLATAPTFLTVAFFTGVAGPRRSMCSARPSTKRHTERRGLDVRPDDRRPFGALLKLSSGRRSGTSRF